jgi:hypothetical protein
MHIDLTKAEHRSCLFGEHLLKRYPKASVHIVESEKTAILCAINYGNLERDLWLSCGGLNSLNKSMLDIPIAEGRNIYLWPDKDGVQEWQQVADKLGSEKVQVYTRFFETCWRECDGPKADCADIIIRMMTKGDQPREPEPKNDETVSVAGIDCVPVEWNTDEPFLDPEEYIDPRVREWREILRNKFNFNKSRK